MLPENYPHKYIRDVSVRDRAFRFRPISPDDDALMISLFNTFSKETIFHRFNTAYIMNSDRVKHFTNMDYRTHMAIVAEEDNGCDKCLVGVARYATLKEASTEAEMAIVIGDPWQGQGIGTALLDHLFVVGEAEGYELFYGLVQYDNAAVPRIFEKLKRPHCIHNTGTELRYEVTLCPKK